MRYEKNLTTKNGDVTYGIDSILDNHIVKSIPDITEDENEINKIVALCNELELELCHIDDIVEDYLTDFCI